MSYTSSIRCLGSYAPPRVVTNKDLEKLMDTTDEWIVQRSGIRERRWVSPGETLCDMASRASRAALEKAALSANDVDAIIFCSLMSDFVFPGTGCLLQRELGCKATIPALDIRNQCSGFLYSLSVADAWIRSGMYQRVLISAAEIHSTGLNISTAGRDVAVLFGDAAASCIVERATTPTSAILDHLLAAEGEHAGRLCLKEPSPNSHPRLGPSTVMTADFYPHMDGSFVFKNAVARMTQAAKGILARNGKTTEDLAFVIPHQANLRISQAVMEQLGLPLSKTHHTLDRFGNTTAASIPLTLNEALERDLVKRGDLVLLLAFGSGFTWGSSLLRM